MQDRFEQKRKIIGKDEIEIGDMQFTTSFLRHHI